MQYAMFERFELAMTQEQAESVSHAGDCSADVEVLVEVPAIASQLDAIGPKAIRNELREYGAWNDDDLADDAANRERIVWIAGCNIREEMRVEVS